MILITAPNCPKCERVKGWLAKNKVDTLCVPRDDVDFGVLALLAENEMLEAPAPVLVDIERGACVSGYINITKYIKGRKDG